MGIRYASSVAWFCVAFLLASIQPGELAGRQLVAGEDYVTNRLIVTFSAAQMPSKSQVSEATGRFSNPVLDAVLADFGCHSTEKILTSYGEAKTASGQRLERMFVLEFSNDIDAQVIRESLGNTPYFDRVSLDVIVEKEYFGIRQTTPPTNTEFDKQWNLHDAGRDSIDIDAPEAWAIEKGDPDVIVVIHDTGIMVDTTTTEPDWNLHSDFNYYWTAEDAFGQEKLNAADLNFSDSESDADTLLDNVIGYNFSPHFIGEQDSTVIRFWHSVPTNWLLKAAKGGGES